MTHPAPPILASTLLVNDQEMKRKRYVGTGCKAIDRDVWGGGFEYGAVCAISGGEGMGKTLVGLGFS